MIVKCLNKKITNPYYCGSQKEHCYKALHHVANEKCVEKKSRKRDRNCVPCQRWLSLSIFNLTCSLLISTVLYRA